MECACFLKRLQGILNIHRNSTRLKDVYKLTTCYAPNTIFHRSGYCWHRDLGNVEVARRRKVRFSGKSKVILLQRRIFCYHINMKRSGFKRKATVPMKKTRLKRKSKSSIRQIQDDLWQECRRIIEEQYGNNKGGVDCYTCSQKDLHGSNKQLGHVPWAKASLGAYLKYDLRVLRYQCATCNLYRGGMGAEAYKRMLREEGQAYMDKLELDRQVTVKAQSFYETLLTEYKLITK